VSAAVSAADERAVCSMYPPQRARARLARTPARITKLLALRSRRSHYEASRAHMHEDVSAHGYRCVASMCTRNAVPGGNGGCHGVGWGVAGVLERVVHLLRSRPAVCSLRRLGVWAQRVPCEGCRAGRPFARSSRALAGPRWRAVPCRGYADYCSSPLLITLTVRVQRENGTCMSCRTCRCPVS
jgi:hypothetical protein